MPFILEPYRFKPYLREKRMPERFRRFFLKEKESKGVLGEASKRFKVDLQQIFKDKPRVEAVETEFAEIFLINGRPIMARTEGTVYPTLTFKEFFDRAPKIVVDMGAVPYVCKGANIMAPGIRRFEGEFSKGDFVCVIDEKHGKPLAIGEALYSVEEAKNVKQGIVLKNAHFVGDRTWDLMKQLITPAR
jgi:PUA-domain protein